MERELGAERINTYRGNFQSASGWTIALADGILVCLCVCVYFVDDKFLIR